MVVLFVQIFFCVWILLMIPWQFQKVREGNRFLSWINRLKILPVYTFFSPNPGKVDSHLLIRDSISSDNDHLTEWKEIITINKRQVYNFVWNPDKRINKMVIDALAELRSINNYYYKLNVNSDDLGIFFQLNRGYITLLNFVSNYDKLSPDSIGRQFMIIDVSFENGKRQVSPLFCSAIHRI